MKTIYGVLSIITFILLIIALIIYFMDGIIVFGLLTIIFQNAYYNCKK